MPRSHKACFFRALIKWQGHTRLVDFKTTNRTNATYISMKTYTCMICHVMDADCKVPSEEWFGNWDTSLRAAVLADNAAPIDRRSENRQLFTMKAEQLREQIDLLLGPWRW